MPNVLSVNRRAILQASGLGLGSIALAALEPPNLRGADAPAPNPGSRIGGLPDLPHFAPKAKRVIYLFQSGGPSHLELFDYKPRLNENHGRELPPEVRRGQRLTSMSGNQSSLPLVGSPFRFAQHGASGGWCSDLMPYTAKIIDKLCIVRSLWTEAINHDPAITYFQTGSQIAGRPSLGAWVSYGLGSTSQNFPAFIVLVTKGKGDQPLYSRLWGNGFLDSQYQGVRFSAGQEPVYYLGNPAGVTTASRRKVLDVLGDLNRMEMDRQQDPQIVSRIAQYEMAFRMQAGVPEAADFAKEPKNVLDLYGSDAKTPGTFAYNCLLARRLAERGVRFVQLYHQGWDQHGSLPHDIKRQAKETDQASAALVVDLERRGLLNDTLVVWGGEFGRTCYSQGKITPGDFGRDHHPRCFSMWLAGAGIKPGFTYGRTDDFGYNIVDANNAPIDPDKSKPTKGAVHIHDLQATILHLLGIDHERLTFRYQGRRFRLTDVHGHVVTDLLS